MTDHLSALIQAVDAADSSASLFKAVQNLAEARLEGAIPPLIAALSYNNPGAAIAAVNGLVQLGEAAVPAIMEQLDLHNYTARAWAIRALAEIGDPRGLVILLEAATSDFAVSVRRAATKGLGGIKWRWFPQHLLEHSQTVVLSALLHIAQYDDEWVVRYAAIAGLQRFASGPMEVHEGRSHIQAQLEQMRANERSIAVCSRVQMAQTQLQFAGIQTSPACADQQQPSPLTDMDWTLIRDRLDTFSVSAKSPAI
jgi:phycocyanobilin lyase subunit beta